MPNWTEITLSCEGISDLPIFTRNESGERELDYNTLIPMPSCVRDTISPVRTDAVINYLFTEYPEDEARKKLSESGLNADAELLKKSARQIIIATGHPEWLGFGKGAAEITAYDLGRNYWLSKESTGYWDWYDWAYENWGVKWNACDSSVEKDTVYFDAPWSYPDKFFDALASRFPDKKFHARMVFEDDWQTAYHIDFSIDSWDEYSEPIPDAEDE